MVTFSHVEKISKVVDATAWTSPLYKYQCRTKLHWFVVVCMVVEFGIFQHDTGSVVLCIGCL